jgi:GNAT superfamily N-acetyltransferase
MRTAISHARGSSDQRVPVGDHRWVSIRPIERSDAAGLSAFYARLSPESRRRRFLGTVTTVDPALIARFATPGDGIVGVLREPGPNDGAVVAHGSVQTVGRARAEVAFAVADELHGRGLGRSLVDAAIRLARERGFSLATASLYADNTPMRRLLRDSAREVVSDVIEDGVEEIELRLAA